MLKKFVFTAVIFVFGSGLLLAQETAPNPPVSPLVPKTTAAPGHSDYEFSVATFIEGKVIKVFDGDTLSVESNDRKVYIIRLLGIDAPEDKQTFADNAKKKLINLLLGKQITVVVKKRDLHDRYLGVIYLKGQDINLKLIESGMAWHHAPYAFEQSSEDRLLYARAEQKARSERVGLWKDENPVSPWNFNSLQNIDDAGDKIRSEKKTGAEPPASKAESKTDPASSSKNRAEKKYFRGSRGGCYYVNSNGNKTYVDRSLCN